MSDARLFSPAAERNAGPLGDVLERFLWDSPEIDCTVLEIASGSGQHVVAFARRFPWTRWVPSDPDPEARESIEAYRRGESILSFIAPPLALDVTEPDWHRHVGELVSAILAINMIHIAPWEATEGLFAGASALLETDGPVVLYGPFFQKDVPTAPSNIAFDESLRARNPRWGVRALEEVKNVAANWNFRFEEAIPMPANNLTVVFRREPRS